MFWWMSLRPWDLSLHIPCVLCEVYTYLHTHPSVSTNITKKCRSVLHGLSRKRWKGPVWHLGWKSFTGRQSHIGITLHFSQLCITLYMSCNQHMSVTGSTWKTTSETHDYHNAPHDILNSHSTRIAALQIEDFVMWLCNTGMHYQMIFT